MKFDTKYLPIDLAGEVLRAFCFDVGEGIFPDIDRLKPGFIRPSREQQDGLIELFESELDKDTPAHYFCYIGHDFRIDVCIQYDHDCTLIIADGPRIYVNSDAKKSHGWKEI